MLASILPTSLINPACVPSINRNRSESATESSTPDLVRFAQAGDDDAFSDLHSKYAKRVFQICMRMVRNFSLAEDLTQETFLQVYRKLASFRGDSAFATWLHRLAVNTVLMHLRKRGLSLVSLDHMMTDVPEERAGRSFGTRDLVQAGAIDRLTIDRAVATLAPGYRKVFLLHDVEGFNHDEIADQLNCTRGNTKSQLHKARRAMRGALTVQASASGGSDNSVQANRPLRTGKGSRGVSTGSRRLSAVQA